MTQGNRTALNMMLVSGASLLQIVNQFVFVGIITAFHGATLDADAYLAALGVSMVLSAVITGSLGYVLVPELTAQFEHDDDHKRAWQLASFLGIVTIAISLLGTLWMFIGADGISRLFEEKTIGKQDLIASLLRILSVQAVLSGIISWAQSVHHGRHQFFLPAMAGVLGTGVSIAYALLASRDIAQIAWAVNLGSLACIAVSVLPFATKLKMPFAESDRVWGLLIRLGPLVLGAALIRVDPLVDRVFASELDDGSITNIALARTIILALLAVGTGSLSVVAFPQLAKRLANEGMAGLSNHLSLALRRLVLIIVPIAVGFSAFHFRIISDLLVRGAFSSEDANTVGWLVVVYMGMFVGASAAELLARAFYVLGDTRTPTIIGAVSFLAGLGLKFLMFKPLDLGIWGIACSVSIYYLVTAVWLAAILTQRIDRHIFERNAVYLVQAVLGACIACGGCYLIYSSSIGATWLAAPAGALAYFSTLLAFRNEEAWQLVEFVENSLAKGVARAE